MTWLIRLLRIYKSRAAPLLRINVVNLRRGCTMFAPIARSAFALALFSSQAMAQDYLRENRGIPLWGKDTRAVLAAFLSADLRTPGALPGEAPALIDLAERRTPREGVPAQLSLSLRVEFSGTRTEDHGPWFLQFKVARSGTPFHSSIPVPRHTVGALTLGTEF